MRTFSNRFVKCVSGSMFQSLGEERGMDSDRADGGGRPQVDDEFACAGMLRGSLTSLHGTVERIFRVTFGIGADDLPHGNNGQIWLKLRGPSLNVKAAKVRSSSCFIG